MRLSGNPEWQESGTIIAPQIRADGVQIELCQKRADEHDGDDPTRDCKCRLFHMLDSFQNTLFVTGYW